MKSKAKLKAAVEVFYSQNHSKGKSYTWNQFKNVENGYSRRGIYDLMTKIDEQGDTKRKPGSGRPMALTKADQQKLKRVVNHKTGKSQ